jgi:hypothetical protein
MVWVLYSDLRNSLIGQQQLLITEERSVKMKY